MFIMMVVGSVLIYFQVTANGLIIGAIAFGVAYGITVLPSEIRKDRERSRRRKAEKAAATGLPALYTEGEQRRLDSEQ